MCLLGLHLSILVPFLFALIVPFIFKYVRRIHTGWFVILVPLLLFNEFAGHLAAGVGLRPVQNSLSWVPSLGIDFAVRLDGLSLMFALIITGIGSLVVLYSIFYMSKEREALGNFYVYLLLFMGAMLGVVLSDNLIVFYTFWEMTSVASFLLISYWHQRRAARYGAQKSMLITVFGGFAMLLGFILLYSISGTFSISQMFTAAGEMSRHVLFLPALVLVLLGAFTKSVQFPFHIWLPDAMEAPTPISAYLHSATMVKAGVYLVARLTPLFGSQPAWYWLVTIVGMTTLFWASFMAIRQVDLKAMLAYSTISQLGLIMSLLGAGAGMLAAPGRVPELVAAGAILAALFHLVNHSIFKGALFMAVGIMDHETGTRDIRRLGGLMKFMPVTFIITAIGAFSMAGLPPFSGFLSKEMFFTGMLNAAQGLEESWAVFLPIVAWVASIFTFIYCMVLVFKPFTGAYHPEMLDKPPHEASPGMLLPPALLAVFVVGVFVNPSWLGGNLLEPAMRAVMPGLLGPGEHFPVHIQAWHGWTTEVNMTIGIVIAGSLLYIFLDKWSALYDFLPAQVSLNNAYNQGLVLAEQVSQRITKTYMTGLLRNYLTYIFLTIIVLAGGALLLLQAVNIDLSSNAGINAYEVALGLTVVAAAVAIVFSTSRLVSILALSAVGLAVSLFFVIFRAPDLALTQLVVETISTTLFLLCFYFLPQMTKVARVEIRPLNALVALGVGATLTLLGLSAQGYRVFEPISYYFENSFELAGALNMVNALLVDFRGFDTLLETVVLFSAGIGVYALIKLRPSRRGES